MEEQEFTRRAEELKPRLYPLGWALTYQLPFSPKNAILILLFHPRYEIELFQKGSRLGKALSLISQSRRHPRSPPLCGKTCPAVRLKGRGLYALMRRCAS